MKIKEVQAGDEVLLLNKETGEIELHKINGLLDMGVKLVFNLTTKDSRSIKTIANHPYLTKNGWVKISELEQGNSIAVPYEKSKNLFNSSVLKTLTEDCSLKCKSFDQIGILSSNANAKNGTSVLCEINLSALSSKNCEAFLNSISSGSRETSSKNFSLVIPDLEQINLEYLCNSFISSLGANNSILYSFNNLLVNESDLNKANIILVSTTNFIYNFPSFFSRFNVSCLSCLPNLMQSSSVNLEFLKSSSNLFNISSCLIFRTNASLANADQFNHANSSIFCFSSSGIDNVIDAILIFNIYDMCPHASHVFKLFGSFSNWLKVSELNVGDEIAVSPRDAASPMLLAREPAEAGDSGEPSDDGVKWVKINVGEEQVYDIEFENTHNFIANDVVAHNTYLGDSTSDTVTVAGNITAQNFLGTLEGSSDFVPYTGATSNVNLRAHNFFVNTTTLFVNKENGEVGIGTTLPKNKLNVVGDRNFTGNLSVSNKLNMFSNRTDMIIEY